MEFAPTLPVVDPKAAPESVTTIHWIEDGVSAFGRIWYRGEELSVQKDTKWYALTQDAEGNSWMDLSPDEQIDRWGAHKFNPGKWAGRSFDLDDEVLSDADREALIKIEKQKTKAAAAVKVSED